MFFSVFLLLLGFAMFMFDFTNQILMILIFLLVSLLSLSNVLEFDYYLGYILMDVLSCVLIMLSIWIVMLMWVNDLDSKSLMKNILNYSLLLFLMFCFSLGGLLEMYVFFEFSLVPLILLIVMGGFSPERVSSSFYMFMYTLLGSLPFILLIFVSMNKEFNLNMFLAKYTYSYSFSYLWMLMFLMFLVKMPMFGLHLWLLKAHVEAPVTGSMILAGLMLKLGGYGLYRLLLFMSINMLELMKIFILCVSVIGGVYIGFMCLRQTDIKMLIAYSSICHMSLVLGGVFSFFMLGTGGVLLLMLAHGLCSSGLFYMANMIYQRFKTRSLILLKNVSFISNKMIVLWFIFLSFNLGAPPSMNFFAELFLLYSIMHVSVLMIFWLVLISFLSGAYSLYLFMQLNHGSFWSLNEFFNESMKELFIVLTHLWPLVFYLMNVYLFVEWV